MEMFAICVLWNPRWGEEHLYDYLEYKMGIHSDVREKLKNGEVPIDNYFDEDICEGLGIGIRWILYGDENCKDYPCGSQIKRYLDKHPERREQIWKWMREDGCEVQDCFHDCAEDDWDEEEIEEYEEYEDFEDDWDED